MLLVNVVSYRYFKYFVYNSLSDTNQLSKDDRKLKHWIIGATQFLLGGILKRNCLNTTYDEIQLQIPNLSDDKSENHKQSCFPHISSQQILNFIKLQPQLIFPLRLVI